ncbi:flagellar hook-length control protein FliK [Amphiplicatus metriothermophilus]|uniref:Hook-length control protein FliK n=1 Tax=Amphiplicatus metriothermophilus TaxID=1519374 RepID=A0A239PKJ5_9PROT|nr:flagellar hook-length control protein FliK [Amphiplicatus metriothermophilus]MBB5517322.1 hypothetical protein [Amphiplicatus metriothermophilus]SNT68342.1 hook-length control protein FliK [Amphiplicatus metriothermophilus]
MDALAALGLVAPKPPLREGETPEGTAPAGGEGGPFAQAFGLGAPPPRAEMAANADGRGAPAPRLLRIAQAARDIAAESADVIVNADGSLALVEAPSDDGAFSPEAPEIDSQTDEAIAPATQEAIPVQITIDGGEGESAPVQSPQEASPTRGADRSGFGEDGAAPIEGPLAANPRREPRETVARAAPVDPVRAGERAAAPAAVAVENAARAGESSPAPVASPAPLAAGSAPQDAPAQIAAAPAPGDRAAPGAPLAASAEIAPSEARPVETPGPRAGADAARLLAEGRARLSLIDRQAGQPFAHGLEALAARESAPAPFAAAGDVIHLQAGEGAPVETAARSEAARAQAGADAARQVIASIRAEKGASSIDVQLDPPDLGKVRIHFAIDRNDSVLATVSSDRGDTLDLLRRHANDLLRGLEDAGFAGVQLEFAAHERNERAPGAGAQEGAGFDAAEDEKIAPRQVTYLSLRENNRLDRLV